MIFQLWLAVSQWLNERASRVNVKCFLCPARSSTFWNPASCCGASGTDDDGMPTYSWGISAPVDVPVLVMSPSTVTAKPVPLVTFRLAYANVVYESPYPNGNRGVMSSLS